MHGTLQTCFACPGDGNQQLPPARNWYRDLDLFDVGFLPNALEDGSLARWDPGRFCDLVCV